LRPTPWVRPHSRWATLSLVSSCCLLWSSRMGLHRYCTNWWCLDLGLSLFSSHLGPESSGDWASLLWAYVEWYLCFVFLHVFSSFMCISTNALLQISPNFKFGDHFADFMWELAVWNRS
jgi:hypothetical protein